MYKNSHVHKRDVSYNTYFILNLKCHNCKLLQAKNNTSLRYYDCNYNSDK